jgi:small redox-active disulfide protein 2
MEIKVLGPGCKNCEQLHSTTLKALEELGITGATIEYVKDVREISKYVMSTPGLMIDGIVVHEGKPLPDMEKIKKIILEKGK